MQAWPKGKKKNIHPTQKCQINLAQETSLDKLFRKQLSESDAEVLNSKKGSGNSFSAWCVLTPGSFRSKDLQTETTGLRERIKHLNDMVFCQQRKVKAMIEEVKTAHLFLLGTQLWCTCTMKLGVGEVQ